MTQAVRQGATPAMLKWFGRADKTGRIFYAGPRGFGKRAWVRCMDRAQSLGFVTASAHGDYYLTDDGRATIAKAEGREP